MRWSHIPMCAVAVLAVAGCRSGISYGQPGAGDVPAPFSSAAADAAAHDLLDAWATTHPATGERPIVAFAPLLVAHGDWSSGEHPEDQEVAFDEGILELAPGFTTTGTLMSTATWSDGVSARVTALPPGPAVEQAVARIGKVQGLPPLVVTRAIAATLTLLTSHGPATVPAWDLTLAQTPVHVVVVAAEVPSASTEPVGTAGRDLPGAASVGIDDVRVGADGRTLTADVTGSPGPATSPCGADYTASVVEDEHAIVVIVVAHGYDGPTPSSAGDVIACSGVGARRSATVVLDAPWADRPVLDVSNRRAGACQLSGADGETGGRFLGICGRTHFSGQREAYVGELVVDPDRRREGIARLLLDHARS